MNFINFSCISIKQVLLIFVFSLLLSVCYQSSSKPILIIGSGLDDKNHRIKEKKKIFKTSEPFSMVLKNVKFTDSKISISIYSINKDGKKTKSRTQTVTIDKKYNYLQINQAFSIPFPGKYIIEFSQQGKPIAETSLIIKKEP